MSVEQVASEAAAVHMAIGEGVVSVLSLFEPIINRLAKRTARLRRSVSPTDAEDMAQEMRIALIAVVPRLVSAPNPMAYAQRVMREKALNADGSGPMVTIRHNWLCDSRTRRGWTDRASVEMAMNMLFLDAPINEDGATLAELLASPTASPEHLVAEWRMVATRAAQYNNALRGLDERHRTVLHLRWIEEQSAQDVATIVSIPVGDVRRIELEAILQLRCAFGVDTADKIAGFCECGAELYTSSGKPPTRCDVCEVAYRRARRSSAVGDAAPENLRISRRKDINRDAAKEMIERSRRVKADARKRRRDEWRAAGLCQLCGKEQATSRCNRCKQLRKAHRPLPG